MTKYLETMDARELHGFVDWHVREVPPLAVRCTFTGLTQAHRALRHTLPMPRVEVTFTHTSYETPTPVSWLRGMMMRAMLGIPLPSGSIRILDLEDQCQSRDIQIFPERPDPVLVHTGNILAENAEALEIRDPDATDLRLLNDIIDKLGN